MQFKLISMIAASAIVLGSLGASAAGAGVSQSCPESRGACQPAGARPGLPKPRGKVNGVQLAPPQFDSGSQVWRAGNHIMY